MPPNLASRFIDLPVCTGKSRRLICSAIISLAFTAAPIGCSNRAHRDLYQQRLALESRVLEDQLYDADYENRRLRDQLEQYQRKVSEAKISTPSIMKPHDYPGELGRRSTSPEASIHAPIADPAPNRPSPIHSTRDLGEGLESDDFDLPMFDDGVPLDPNELAVPEQPAQELPAPITSAPKKPATRQPAPGLPVPPGKRDTDVPPIIPGDILPPPRDSEDARPPGQILLPNFSGSKAGVPEKLNIHPTLSTGHHTDGKLDGAVIVIGAVDGDGRPVNISDFDIDAELSIVVLDPTRSGDEALVGRWDFNRRQVQTLVRDHPVSGFHVPVEWADDAPDGDGVIVHVRLRGDDTDMRCDSELKFNSSGQPTITDWTPRGSKMR